MHRKRKNLYTWLLICIAIVFLSACGSLGSNNVDGEDMMRVQETGAWGAYNPLVAGGVGGCRVEKVGELPAGMVFEYHGEKCHVRVEVP